MDIQLLRDNVKSTSNNGRSIGAFDESAGTIQDRITSLGISQEAIDKNGGKAQIAELLRSTQAETAYKIHLGGVILAEDTMRQKNAGGKTIPEIYRDHNINVFYKADKGLDSVTKPGHYITKGIKGLEENLRKQRENGANGAKWRALLNVGAPEGIIERNCEDLAEYAITCQRLDMVPIVEPEIFLEGDYTIQQAKDFHRKVFDILLKKLEDFEVYLPGIILKPSFVSAGKQKETSSPEDIARYTQEVLKIWHLKDTHIHFLSGGHPFGTCVKVLNILNQKNSVHQIAALSASFGRGLSGDKNEGYLCLMKKYLETGNEDYKELAKQALVERAKIIQDAITLPIYTFQEKYKSI